MKGLGTDEQEIIDVIAWRGWFQRQCIKNEYEQAFGRVSFDIWYFK